MLDAENDKALIGFAPMNPSVYSCLSGVGLDFTSADVRRQDLGGCGAVSAEGHEAHKAMACGTLALRGGALVAVGQTARLSQSIAPRAVGHEAHKAMACGTLVLRGGPLAAAGLTARLSREHAPCARTR